MGFLSRDIAKPTACWSTQELPHYFEAHGLSEKVRKGATYHTVHSRLQVEDAMLKDGQITLTDDLVGFLPHSDETDTESSDEEFWLDERQGSNKRAGRRTMPIQDRDGWAKISRYDHISQVWHMLFPLFYLQSNDMQNGNNR